MFPLDSTASSKLPSEHVSVSRPQGPGGGPAFAPVSSSQFQWAIKSMHGSKLGPPGNEAEESNRPTWEPMEAKAGPLEVMTLPTSLQQDNPDNYSGEGKDHNVEDASTPSSARAASGEEREIEGSSEGSNFPGGFGVTVNNLDSVKPSPETESALSHSELVTVAEHTTLSQWQLVEQPTTLPQHSQEPNAGEEARGEILYVRRPTDKLFSASIHGRENNSNAGLGSVLKKHNTDTRIEEVASSTPEPLMEVLTTSEVTTVELLKSRGTDPTTSATTTGKFPDSFSTEEPSISISWVQEEKERTSAPSQQEDRATTSAPTEGSQPTSVSHLTTLASESKVGATEMESRSAVSESFVVGSRWTPFKGPSSKSEEHKTTVTTDNKDTDNPYGILVPNWDFGLIPSGM